MTRPADTAPRNCVPDPADREIRWSRSTRSPLATAITGLRPRATIPGVKLRRLSQIRHATLMELQLLGLLQVNHISWGAERVRWQYSLAPGIDRADLDRICSRNVSLGAESAP
jgi:hypothetical protein